MWKAHEFATFLFTYAVQLFEHLVLTGHITAEVAEHWYLLVCGLTRLNLPEITPNDLNVCYNIEVYIVK